MPELIEDYDIQLAEPACGAGSARYGALVSLESDISAVFPYLNAVLPGARYDHRNQFLLWSEGSQKYAFRPREIRVAEVQDPLQAQEVVRSIVERVNRVWQEKDSLTPNFVERVLPAVMDIFKLLPRTNCRKCGYLTCMAYAAALREGKACLEDCPPMVEADKAESREKLTGLFSG
ncbi:MAG: (Fe-S)-binding protein [Chloroflexota bacterium]